MKIIEKTAAESINDGVINLYLEGMFWKAYQQSAYLFTKNVASFKLTKKEIKKTCKDLVYLGFPKTSLEKLFDEKEIIVINEKQVKIEGYEYNENV